MKNPILCILSTQLATLILAGCSTVLYVPNGQNVPLLKEKNEARVSATGNSGGYSEGFEFQAAYAMSDKIGIIANAFHTTILDLDQTDSDGFALKVGKVNMGEIGLGYFKPFSEKAIFEVYGGLGFGKIENRDSIFGLSSANFFRLFVQPSIGRTWKHIEYAFSTRIGLLNYGQWEHESNKSGQTTWVIDRNTTHLLFEPAITLRAGWPNIKLQLQTGFSMNLSQFYRGEESLQEPFAINLGIHYAIRSKKKV